MKLCLKITAGLLLLAQAFSLASLQTTTDSPGRTIDRKWQREFPKKLVGSLNISVSEEKDFEQDNDGNAMESTSDYSGIASGSIAVSNEEEENVASKDKDANESDDTVVFTTTMPLDVTPEQHEFEDMNISQTTVTTDQTKSTDAEEDFYRSTTTPQNSTTLPSGQNATSFPDYSNQTHLNITTLEPEIITTQEPTTTREGDSTTVTTTATETTTTKETTTTTETTETTTATETTETTTATETTTTTETTETTTPSTVTTEVTNTPTFLLTTTLSDSWTTAINPETTTTTTVATMMTSERGNETDKAGASVSDSERGLASDPNNQRRSTWGTILGTVVVVVCVGLVAFVILKHKHQKGFSHRKLVEEFPSDPVLRLDNSEPLDLNFGGSAYYNPAVQGDNIQMDNFP